MGLLDSILGSVMNEQPGSREEGAGTSAPGALGGLGGLLATAAQNPRLIHAVMDMLASDGGQGGLPGLIEKFQRAGLGDVIGSWLGSGANHPVSAEQLTQILGQGTVSTLGERTGMSSRDVTSQLAQMLPGLVDHFSPQGKAPEGGLGNAGDLMQMLGGMLRK